MTENSINTVRTANDLWKYAGLKPLDNLTSLEETEMAAKALAKIQQYAEFYQRLDVGAELSDNLLKDVKRLRRYIRHRLDAVRGAA